MQGQRSGKRVEIGGDDGRATIGKSVEIGGKILLLWWERRKKKMKGVGF
jgi:hypothetical protein